MLNFIYFYGCRDDNKQIILPLDTDFQKAVNKAIEYECSLNVYDFREFDNFGKDADEILSCLINYGEVYIISNCKNYPYKLTDDDTFQYEIDGDYSLLFYIGYDSTQAYSEYNRLNKEFRQYYLNVRKERDNGNDDGWKHYIYGFNEKLFLNLRHYSINEFYIYTIPIDQLVSF